MNSRTLLCLCREELHFLVRDYFCRVRRRRWGFATPAVIFKQRSFALEVYYDTLDNDLLFILAPVSFGITLWWKRVDVEAIFAANCRGRQVDRGPIDDRRTDDYHRRVLKSFGTILQDCAADYLRGDFRRLCEIQETVAGRAERRRRKASEEMRRALKLRRQRRTQ